MEDFFLAFKNWISGGITAGLLFFLVRYVTRRDKFEDAQDTFKRDVTQSHDKFKQEVKDEIGKKIKDLTDLVQKVQATAEEMRSDADEIKNYHIEFKREIMDELMEIKKEAVEIGAALTRTTDRASEVESKFERMVERVEGLVDSVEKIQKVVNDHHRSLSLGAQAFVKQRDDIAKIKSEVHQIGSDLILIKTKKNGGGDG